jgi:NDP-sugar pyrophosphorylase family protein
MVLAAGKGTRLRPLTDVVPKPAAPVAGKPIIGHIFELLAESGFEEVHVNVHHLADVLLDLYGGDYRVAGVPVHLSREEELLGTAGSVKRLASLAGGFDETFVVVMGDALTDMDLNEVVAFHKEKGALATMSLLRVDDTEQYGVVELDGGGNILGFQEKPRSPEAISNLANTGVYVLEPEVLDYIPEGTFYDFAHDVFPRLLRAGERFVGYDEGDFYWSDIGTLEAYRQAQADALSGRVRLNIPGERRGDGVRVARSASVHPSAVLEGPVVIGADAVVGPGVTLRGEVAVGDGCWLRPGATIERSVLLPGTYVGDGARVKDCIVGPGYDVRAGETILGEALVGQAPNERRRFAQKLDDSAA